MKIYKIQIKIIPVDIYWFKFLERWKRSTFLECEYWIVYRKFKKLNWNWKDVYEMTMYCGSLHEAVSCLFFKLTENTALWPRVKLLIENGYENKWEI